MMKPAVQTILCLLLCATARLQGGELPEFKPNPIPRMQALPLPLNQVSFTRNGSELARYYYGSDLRRPFVYPINGPSGRSLTRMGHPQDPETHSHHNSIWISHHDVNGNSFWGDTGNAKIIHKRAEKLTDSDESSSFQSLNAWVGGDGKVLLNEKRLTSAVDLGKGEWLLLIDLELEAATGAVTFGKTPFGLVGVRMAKSIGVHDGGGRIRNSEGGVNETGVFWKPARWMDYSGLIQTDIVEGITLMDHPKNPNHPTVFHVRNDGWMGTCLTQSAPLTLEKGKTLRLRYGMFVHAGMPSQDNLDRRWREFAEMPLPALAKEKK